MSGNKIGQSGLTRRGVLKLGAGVIAGSSAMPFMAGYVNAAGEQVLKVAHPAFDQDWSPLRGGGPHFRWNSAWWASPMYFDGEGKIHPYVFKLGAARTTRNHGPSRSTRRRSSPTAAKSPRPTSRARGNSRRCRAPRTSASTRCWQGRGYADVTGGTGKEFPGCVARTTQTVVVTLAAADPIFFMRLANHIAPIIKAAQSRGEDGNENDRLVLCPTTARVFIRPVQADEHRPRRRQAGFRAERELLRHQAEARPDRDHHGRRQRHGDVSCSSRASSTPTPNSSPRRSCRISARNSPQARSSRPASISGSTPRRAPMDDPKVRQALIMAVDRDGLMKASFPDGPHKKTDQILNSVPGADEFRLRALSL